MTREEEAIVKLTTHLIHWRQLLRDHICPQEEGTATINALELAIESLKQKSVLDKIRAEIKKSSCGKWYVGRLDGKPEEVLILDEVLQIIDKYRAESEE